jgi:hypothetical protein
VCVLAPALCLQRLPLSSSGPERPAMWSGWLWGAFVPILPLLGDFGISAVSIGMVGLLGGRRLRLDRVVWILPLLSLMAGTVVVEVLRYGAEFFGSVSINDFARARGMLEWFLNTHAHSWKALSWVVTFGLVVALFESVPPVFDGVRRGLGVGIACAALVTIAQHLDLFAFVLPNQTAFWTGINRLSGTFSDPNAQGICLALSYFLIAGDKRGRESSRWFFVLLSILIVVAGLLSGSRSFVLALIIGALVGAWWKSRRLVIVSLLAGMALILSVSLLDLYTPWFSQVVSSDLIPEGGRRVLMSCSVVRATESFFSRGIFFRMGLGLFEHFPLFGVGVNQFRSYVPALVAQLGLDIGGWTDNSNNFYLGLLTELGLLGTLVFIVTVAGRALVVKGADTFCLSGLIVLGFLLLTGPHLDFPEVLFLTAGLVAASTRSRDFRALRVLTVAGISVTIGALSALAREQGGYLWEAQRGHSEQWLSPAAEIAVACSCDGSAELILESSYVPTTSPLTVSVRASSGESRVVDFTRSEAQKLTFRCPNQPSQMGDHNPGKMKFSILTTPGWSPSRAWPEKSRDTRILGIRVRVRRWQDLLGIVRCATPSRSVPGAVSDQS